ncbi:MAG: PSP1 domain-containing protein [Phycisphaerales bacterium]|jgi:cell fate regulator YaaT (PSP1 superfamily)
MSIFPLPVFEADADPARRDAMTDAEIYARLKPPTSIVIRYGVMKAVAEYPYDGPSKPGCGSKLVARTHRGLEVVEMLTTTCSNSGCGKSVSRQEMLEYIENSGGRDYPFRTDGKILRVATVDDLARWSSIQAEAREKTKPVKAAVRELGLDMKVVEIEPTLGGEVLTVYYTSETRVDFRELVKRIAAEFKTRIEMRQVGARDEARLVADYERCGQHCCCKNFLKVLKPISMRSAKTQKGTIDPLKISGRCGRLMCCLRYEDETYEDLKKRLPKNKSRVGTPEGPGIVIDSKILVQLVLVRLEADGRDIAVPVEELCDPDACPPPSSREEDAFRGFGAAAAARLARGSRESRASQQDRHREQAQQQEAPSAEAPGEGSGRKRKRRRRKSGDVDATAPSSEATFDADRDGSSEAAPPAAESEASGEASAGEAPAKRKRKRRRRKARGGEAASSGEATVTDGAGDAPAREGGAAEATAGDGEARKRRRRRRRRGKSEGGDTTSGGGDESGGGA